MKFKYILPVALLLASWGANAQNELSLDNYRELVLNYNQDIKKAQEQIIATDAKRKSIRTGFLPAIDFQGDYFYNLREAEKGGRSPHIYQAGVTLSQNLWDGGYTWASNKSGKIQKEISILAEDQTLNNIIYQADLVYWTAAANKDMYQTMIQYHSIVKSLFDVISKRFEDGLIARTDLLMVQTRLKEAEVALTNAKKSYLIANQGLNVLMGIEPNADNSASESINTQIPIPEFVTVNEALDNRPEFAIAEKQIELAEQNKNIAKSKTNPKFYVGAKAGYGNQNVFMYKTWQNGLFASVQIPLFHGGDRFYSTKAAKANVVIQQLNLQQTADQISLELSNAITSVEESGEAIRIAMESLNIAKQSLDINTFSYNEGRLTILDVLQSQLSWIQASSNLIQANLAHKVAIADYKKVIGE